MEKKEWGKFDVQRVVCGRCNNLRYKIDANEIKLEEINVPVIKKLEGRDGKPVKGKQKGVYVYFECNNCGARVLLADLNFSGSSEKKESKWFAGKFVMK